HRAAAIFLRQIHLLRQSPLKVINLLYWSLFELILWGLITHYLYQAGGERFGFITVILAAVIFWNFFNRIQQNLCFSFLEDLRSRNLVNLFVSPLTIQEYLAGLMLLNVVVASSCLAGTAMTAYFLRLYDIFQFGFLLIPFILIFFLFGWSLGIFITAAVLRFGSSAELLMWSIPTFVMPLSGVFYPIETLPKFAEGLAYLLPTSYIFEGMREIVHRGSFSAPSLLTAAVLSIIYFTAAMVTLLRVYRTTVKLGLLVRPCS
ncbi:MAG: ABC transporter permease, partial [Candidatus Omnitrophica bacterium]|nr:ABC transporter permease [Candidatus Omnitrophota bacterium]